MIVQAFKQALSRVGRRALGNKPVQQQSQMPDFSAFMDETSVMTTRGSAVLQFKLMCKKEDIQRELADDPKSVEEYQAMYQRAEDFLLGSNCCRKLLDVWNGLYVDEILGVFLFKIDPASEEIDEWMWVVVGDIPSAVIMIDDCPNGAAALAEYVDAMRGWIDAVRNGNPVEDLVPVNVPPKPEWADQLEGRMNFISEQILVDYAPYIERE